MFVTAQEHEDWAQEEGTIRYLGYILPSIENFDPPIESTPELVEHLSTSFEKT